MGTVFKVGDRVLVNMMYGWPYENNMATIVEVKFDGWEYVVCFDANPDTRWTAFSDELELVPDVQP